MMVLVQTLYIEDVLGDKDIEAEEKHEAREESNEMVFEKNAILKE
ncbi:MAG: hypothetical protein WKF71_02650 [Pyrinomonadaceae bacterium]